MGADLSTPIQSAALENVADPYARRYSSNRLLDGISQTPTRVEPLGEPLGGPCSARS